eukprot:1158982-Pelagomonas_calceolata.AAC.3
MPSARAAWLGVCLSSAAPAEVGKSKKALMFRGCPVQRLHSWGCVGAALQLQRWVSQEGGPMGQSRKVVGAGASRDLMRCPNFGKGHKIVNEAMEEAT